MSGQTGITHEVNRSQECVDDGIHGVCTGNRIRLTGDRGGSMQPSNGYTEPLFIAVVRLLQTPNTLPPLTMIQATKDEYFTQHTPTGTIIRTDHRIATVAGYMTGEVTGMSAFDYIHPEDQEFALKAQSLSMMQNFHEWISQVYQVILLSLTRTSSADKE